MPMSNKNLYQFGSNESYRKPAHRRDGSDELDVFEAARYFSGSSDAVRLKERDAWEGMEVKSTLGVHLRSPVPSQSNRVEKVMKEKKLKQPSSPGGRLASFLNSLFHQTAGSKKKSKSTSTKSNTTNTAPSVKKDVEEDIRNPAGGRSRRRNSISQSQSTRNSSKSISIYSCPGTGFRTPPPYINTPIKVYKDLNVHQNIKSNGHDQLKSVTSLSQSEVRKINAMNVSRSGGRSKQDRNFLEKNCLSINGFMEEEEEEGLGSSGFVERRWVLNRNRKGAPLGKDMVWVDGLPPRQKNFWWSEERGDGGESDSSSDLFDLPNHDLGG